MLDDYVNASDKQDTELYRMTAERLEKYPDEYQSFYIPKDDEDAAVKIISGRSFIAHLKTVRWLLKNDEDEELLLLLYQGVSFFESFL